MKKDLAYYWSLAYRRRVDRVDEDDGSRYYVASVTELDGCIASGDSRPEAIANLKAAFDEYIEAMIEWGNEIAEPAQGRPKARGGMFKYDTNPPVDSSGIGITKHPDGLQAA